MPVTLSLPAPYGLHDSGVWIKLSVIDGTKYDKSRLICVLMDYSCHVPAMLKIYNCLIYSNEYSCILQRSWFNDQYIEVSKRLFALGIKLTVLKVVNAFGQEEHEHKYFKVNQLSYSNIDPINDFEPINVPQYYRDAVIMLTNC